MTHATRSRGTRGRLRCSCGCCRGCRGRLRCCSSLLCSPCLIPSHRPSSSRALTITLLFRTTSSSTQTKCHCMHSLAVKVIYQLIVIQPVPCISQIESGDSQERFQVFQREPQLRQILLHNLLLEQQDSGSTGQFNDIGTGLPPKSSNPATKTSIIGDPHKRSRTMRPT